MTTLSETTRYLAAEPASWLVRPQVRVQPVQAREGKPNIDLGAVAKAIQGVGRLEPVIPVESPEHWGRVIRTLPEHVDAILPVSIAAYPTEVWNSHPQPLMERKLPLLFWPLTAYDEPDFWRWSARDFLSALGVDVHLVRNARHGVALLRALAVRRLLRGSKLVVFGEQNFPWNAPAAGHLVTQSLGTRIVVHPMASIRDLYHKFTDEHVGAVWAKRRGRYVQNTVRPDELRQAVRTYLAIREVLESERAMGFGVNCFGDLIIRGGRDVPCLAQCLLREDGYIASCDGDWLAMMSMVLTTFLLDKPCMMSNMYPLRYVGALRDHFGDPLSPPEAACPRQTWANLARLGHCGWVGVVPPEMDTTGKAVLNDWGGTYEIRRDGRGCGIDAELAAGERITVVELKFDGRTLLVADGQVVQTTRHGGMPHCESTALLRFGDLEGFVENISREHTVVVYGDHVEDFQVLAGVLGLDCKVF